MLTMRSTGWLFLRLFSGRVFEEVRSKRRHTVPRLSRRLTPQLVGMARRRRQFRRWPDESPTYSARQDDPFTNFTAGLFNRKLAGTIALLPVLVSRNTGKAYDMKNVVLASVAAATIGITAMVVPSPAQAWRGGGWGPGLAGGLIAGAVIGGIASSAYAYGPGYGYYGGPGGYYGGYAPAYYGGYGSYYAPAYYGPRYRRVARPAYAYRPRYYGGYGSRW
jgi:hypothetical protein